MKSVGNVVNISKKGMLILRTEKAPRIGDTICDRKKAVIGKVSRVTGPVRKPFVFVKPFKDADRLMTGIVGSELFIGEGKERRTRSEKRNRKSPAFTKRGGRYKGRKEGDAKRKGRHKGRTVHRVKDVKRR